MPDLRSGLHGLHSHLGELEDKARTLPNQNFADIVKSARAKLFQLLEHPDIDKVAEAMHEPEGPFGEAHED